MVSSGEGGTWRHDLPASAVVFLVALPLCMGIAIASGVPPEKAAAVGIMTGVIGGIVVGLLAGSPLLITGPAAGLSVLVFDLVHDVLHVADQGLLGDLVNQVVSVDPLDGTQVEISAGGLLVQIGGMSVVPNFPPDAADDAAVTLEGTAVTIDVLANDSDVNGDVLIILAIGIGPTHGTAVISNNANFIIYTPAAGFTGTDTFLYTISDGRGGTASIGPSPQVTTPSRLLRRAATWPTARTTPSATSALRRSAVPKIIEGETSRTSQVVSDRSATSTRTCASPVRAVTFQSMRRTSSPGA